MSAVRVDRYLTLSVFRALHRPGLGGAVRCVPILMYHSISDEPEDGVEPYYRLATNPRRFAEHMQWLHDSGYQGVFLETALATLADEEYDHRPQVAITFDDGLRNFYTEALPVIQQYGFTATMYLPTAFIGSHRRSFLGRECLTWDEVRELHKHGIRFGSHTVSHPKLHELPWNAIKNELERSKLCIERELEEEISGFAYPYAFPQEDQCFTSRFAELLRGLGYQSCVTTVIGRTQPGDDAFCLKRLPVNSCDDEDLFFAKLHGAYDWLGSAQRTVRQLKRLTGRSVTREAGSAA
jgi:peptidoglycan/xylan/chitin deacetylase (PgdA/CDA1 family)